MLMISFNSHSQTITMVVGAGSFIIAGEGEGEGKVGSEGKEGTEQKIINVHYYMPVNFTPDSPILFVLHGNNRKGEKLRNDWIKASEQYGVLILAPVYSKAVYPTSQHYHLANMIKKENGKAVIINNPNAWLFADFDRMFTLVKASTDSKQSGYDLFGHSAGGQVAHRFAIFSPESKANRIVAANSGWYTSIDFKASFPYGLRNSPLDNSYDLDSAHKLDNKHHSAAATLALSFRQHLTILLGEQDTKINGSIRRNKAADEQGLSRLARGNYFFNKAKIQADKLNIPYHWQIRYVPNIGHSSSKMSHAAAAFLYGNKSLSQ